MNANLQHTKRFAESFQLGGSGVDILDVSVDTNRIFVDVSYASAEDTIEGEINVIPEAGGDMKARTFTLPAGGDIVSKMFNVNVPEREWENYVVTALRTEPSLAQDQRVARVPGVNAATLGRFNTSHVMGMMVALLLVAVAIQ